MRSYHPRHIHHHFLRNLHIPSAFCALLLVACLFTGSTFLFASATSNFRMVINPGTLAVNVVDGNFVPISQPVVDMGSLNQGSSCQSVTGVFGTSSQIIYIKNPDAADNGWNVTLSASSPIDRWSSANGAFFDFNDPTTAGCTDGADADADAGRMTINPSSIGSLLAQGQCVIACNMADVVKGSVASFQEGAQDSITVLSGAPGSSDAGDWMLTGVQVTQTIPTNQAPSDQYSLDLYLTVTAI